MNDAEYWSRFYAGAPRMAPSPFARWCERFIGRPEKLIIDAGCGDMRDSVHFALLGHDIVGIDPCGVEPKEKWWRGVLIRGSVTDAECRYAVDVVYSRWLLHALTAAEQEEFVRLVAGGGPCGSFFIECRSANDDRPPRTTGHYRRPLRLAELVAQLQRHGFAITFAGEQRGWSRDGDDDPLLIRIVASKR
jgi:hypothetical protein